MNCKIIFRGYAKNVSKAKNAMRDFNSIIMAPDDFHVLKLDASTNDESITNIIAIIEDYFYCLLYKRGEISEEQGEKALSRYNEDIKEYNPQVVSGLRFISESMLDDYKKYGCTTLKEWKQKYWGVPDQPEVKTYENGQIKLCNVPKVPHGIIDAVCALYDVTASVTY